MALNINLKKKVHRKVWEPLFLTTPAASAAGTIFVGDDLNLGANYKGDTGRFAVYATGVSALWWYNKQEEAFGQLPNSGSAGTWGAGAAGAFHPFGPSFTASAGTTNSFTSTQTIVRSLQGMRFRVTGGTNRGLEGIIKSNTYGANSVITTEDTYGVAFDNTSVIQLLTGRFWLYVPGATSGFNYYDWALNTWTSRSVVSGPAITTNEGALIATAARSTEIDYGNATSATSTTLTDASRNWETNVHVRRLVHIISGTGANQWRYITANTATTITVDTAWATTPDTTSVYVFSGIYSDVASAGSTTTITVSAGTPWTASQWINYQVRCVAGTGAGQTSVITANTNNQLTFGAVTTGFDNTSRYVIEPDDNAFFFLGGAAVTLFKYSISGNTWATVTPGAARAGAAAAGMSASYVNDVNNIDWVGVGTAGGPGGARRQNGRFIYSFRGGGVSTLDVYDIPANTWYSAHSYGGASNETFTTGSVWCDHQGSIYGQKDATGRIFMFTVLRNEMIPYTTCNITQGTAVSGARLMHDEYVDPTNGKEFLFLMFIPSTSSQIQRLVHI
jgi:hypothetical protein